MPCLPVLLICDSFWWICCTFDLVFRMTWRVSVCLWKERATYLWKKWLYLPMENGYWIQFVPYEFLKTRMKRPLFGISQRRELFFFLLVVLKLKMPLPLWGKYRLLPPVPYLEFFEVWTSRSVSLSYGRFVKNFQFFKQYELVFHETRSLAWDLHQNFSGRFHWSKRLYGWKWDEYHQHTQ